MKTAFGIGQEVRVDEADYTGKVVETRQNGDGSVDYLVRYVVEGARKPFYETWWPERFLAHAAKVSA